MKMLSKITLLIQPRTIQVLVFFLPLFLTQSTFAAEALQKNETSKAKSAKTHIPQAYPDLAVTHIAKSMGSGSPYRYGSCENSIKVRVKTESRKPNFVIR